jgi:MazG family protein
MRTAVVEEAYEVVDAIERGDDANLEEEIGDLFLVLSAIVRMKEEQGAFGPREVFEAICAKLVRRHPHVFGSSKVSGSAEVLQQWERIKSREPGKDQEGSALDGVPRSRPPLERALGLQKKAAKKGFDWDRVDGILDKLAEERRELEQEISGAADPGRVASELGDLLFTVVNLSRFLKADPSRALAATNRTFERRFRELERRAREQGRDLESMTLQEMDGIWEDIKREEGSGAPTARPGSET